MRLADWLIKEPFHLSLSSGFFGFFAHAGFVKALEEAGIRPASISGSSSGALVAGCWASGLSADAIRDELLALKQEDFWDPGFGLGLLKGNLFKSRLHSLLPVHDFSECVIPLKVSAFHVSHRRTVVLDQGDLNSAIRASCAVPIMFQPVWIGKQAFLDGGIKDRPGIAGFCGTKNMLYHHLPSQSWWRRKNSDGVQIPSIKNMNAISIDGLPKLGPSRLEYGPKSFELAFTETSRRLNAQLPLPNG
jgi:NTE family protein